MKSIFSAKLVGLVTLLVVAATGMTPLDSAATPDANSAVIKTRIFNDCPTSILSTTNQYPAQIIISDSKLDCGGFANLHNWRLSEDGANPSVFDNDSAYKLAANLTISGTAEGEAGLQVSPWWSQDVDGRFNVRTTDGEVAVFGGRLPFYSFTAQHGVVYLKGTTIRVSLTYQPNGLSMANPATMEYEVLYNNTLYNSGPLPFDEGNPNEDPPYGLWGMLNDGRVGGHIQPFLQGGNPNANLQARWSNIKYLNLKGPISVEDSSWGKVKSLYR